VGIGVVPPGKPNGPYLPQLPPHIICSLQKYTSSPNNIRVADGNLHITALKVGRVWNGPPQRFGPGLIVAAAAAATLPLGNAWSKPCI
jgi:hypothetical protein